MLVFLIGLVAGVLGTLFLPRILGPYLPQSLRGADQEMVGVVTAKERQADQLLLTVDSESGAVLATFSRRVAEIALLGDTLTSEQLERWGLVNRVVSADEVLDTALALAQRLAAGPTRSLGLAKRLYRRALEIRESVLGPRHARVGDTLNNLGTIL